MPRGKKGSGASAEAKAKKGGRSAKAKALTMLGALGKSIQRATTTLASWRLDGLTIETSQFSTRFAQLVEAVTGVRDDFVPPPPLKGPMKLVGKAVAFRKNVADRYKVFEGQRLVVNTMVAGVAEIVVSQGIAFVPAGHLVELGG